MIIQSSKEIPAVGPLDAEMILIGEAPASQEIQQNKPFVGPSGYHLDFCLRKVGISRSDLRITNLSKKAAPGFKMANLSMEEIRNWERKLIPELNSYENAKILIPLGDYALQAVTGRSGISHFRGSVMHPIPQINQNLIVIPTYHPSTMNYNYECWPLISFDLSKAKNILDNIQNFQWPQFNFILKPSLNKVIETLRYLEETNPRIVTIDVETPHGLLSCIGLGWSRTDAICIPFFYGDRTNYWTEEEEVILWKEMMRVLPKLNFANQNFMYDIEVMLQYGIQLKIPEFDPMLMHHCLYSDLPHKLDVITSIYTNLEYYKSDERDSDEGPMKGSTLRVGKEMEHWRYNALDCIAALWCIEEMEIELREANLYDVYKKLYVNLYEPLFKMNLRGVRIDMKNLADHQKFSKERMALIKKELDEKYGSDFKPNSPKQVKDLLLDKMGMDGYHKRGTNSISMDKENLQKMALKYNSDIPYLIIEYRTLAKESSLFSEENIEDGRIRTKYGLSKSKLGRLESKKTFSKTGMNLQNVKRGNARRFFLPEEGEIMVKCDQKQAEARVVAWLTRDQKMIDAAESGMFHLENAKNIYGPDLSTKEKVKAYKETEQYIHVKACGHGGNYGMGINQLAIESKMSKEAATEIYTLYHNTYPGIVNVFHKEVEEQINRTRMLVNPFGRRMIFFGRLDRKTYKKGYAFIPQSTVTDVNKIANQSIDPYFTILMDTHDGLNISVPEKKLEASFLMLIWAYKQGRFQLFNIWHEIPIEIGFGMNWLEMKDVQTEELEIEVDSLIKRGIDVPKHLGLK